MTRTNAIILTMVVGLGVAAAGCKRAVHANAPTPAPQAGAEDDYRKHEEWFMFQRTYPNNVIPVEARRKAWESLKQRGLLQPQSSAPSWNSVGPISTTADFSTDPLETGRINAVAVSPADQNVVLVGSAAGGVWRSSDAGATFVPVSDNNVDLAVGSISFAPSDPSIVYAGMGDPYNGILGTGVLKSTDEGQTWTRVDDGSLPQPGLVTRIKVDPLNPNRVYLAQYADFDLSNGVLFSSGFFLSTNGGVTWTKTFPGLPRDLVINPSNHEILYLAMSRVDQAPNLPGLFQSTDGGQTWGQILLLPYNPNQTFDVYSAMSADGQMLYVYSGGNVGNNFQLNLYLSTDGGKTFRPRSVSGIDPGQFGYNSYIEIDPNNPTTVYVGSRDVYKSTDGGGSSWVNLTKAFTETAQGFGFSPDKGISHADQHALTFVPGSSTNIYIGNDGGLSFSTDAGNSYVSLNTSLSLTMFYSIKMDPGNPLASYGGTQDNGVQRRVSGSVWNQMVTGDGGNLLISPKDDQTLLVTDDGANIFQFGTQGNFETVLASPQTFGEAGSSPRAAFLCPIFTDTVDSTIYFCTWRMFKSTDIGVTWNPTAGTTDLTKGVTANGPDVVTAGAVGPANPNIIYTGSAQGRVMVSQDGGAAWTDITGSLPNRSVSGIAVDSTDSATAYLTFSGYLAGHIFKTSDMGAKWTDITGNLPDLPVHCVLIDPRNPRALYVGNDIGVFQSAFGGPVWQPLINGIPPVMIQALSANQSGLIQAGTYGRGAYQITPALPPIPFTLTAAQASLTAAPGATVSVDLSINRIGGYTDKVVFAGPPGLPTGVKVKGAKQVSTKGSSAVFKLKLAANTTPGTYPLAFTAADSKIGLTQTASVVLTVQ